MNQCAIDVVTTTSVALGGAEVSFLPAAATFTFRAIGYALAHRQTTKDIVSFAGLTDR